MTDFPHPVDCPPQIHCSWPGFFDLPEQGFHFLAKKMKVCFRQLLSSQRTPHGPCNPNGRSPANHHIPDRLCNLFSIAQGYIFLLCRQNPLVQHDNPVVLPFNDLIRRFVIDFLLFFSSFFRSGLFRTGLFCTGLFHGLPLFTSI